MSGPQKKMAMNPKRLLESLGLPPTRKYERALLDWSHWDGFPKRGQHGWPVAEVATYIASNAKQIAEYWTVKKVASGKVTPADMKILEKAVNPPANPGEPNGAAQAGAELPGIHIGLARTVTALAAMLKKHYGNTVSIIISTTAVHNWKKGINLPPNAPLPPAQDGNYWRGEQWVAWFDQYMLPVYRVQSSAQGTLLPAQEFALLEASEKLEDLKWGKQQREIEQGLWVKKETVLRVVERIGVADNARITQIVEREMVRHLTVTFGQVEMADELRQKLQHALHVAARVAADGLRSAFREQFGATSELTAEVV
jgi:hypothetical protein